MYELNFKSWACIILTGLFLVVGGVGIGKEVRKKKKAKRRAQKQARRNH